VPWTSGKSGLASIDNIIRDVHEDYKLGRNLFPKKICSVTELHPKTWPHEATPAFAELLRFEAERAWQLYEEVLLC